jgi:hypothetical protein
VCVLGGFLHVVLTHFVKIWYSALRHDSRGSSAHNGILPPSVAIWVGKSPNSFCGAEIWPLIPVVLPVCVLGGFLHVVLTHFVKIWYSALRHDSRGSSAHNGILPPSVTIWVGKSPNSFCGAEIWPLIPVFLPVCALRGFLHVVITHFVKIQYSALERDSRRFSAQNGILPPSVAIWVGKSPNSFREAENWLLAHVVSPVCVLHGCLRILLTHFVKIQYSALRHDSRTFSAQNGISPPSVAIWVGKSPNSFCGAENWPLIDVVSPVWFLHGCLHIILTHFVHIQYSALGHDSRSLSAQNGILPPSVAIWLAKSPNSICGAENWQLIHVVSPVCVLHGFLRILFTHFVNIEYSVLELDSRSFFAQNVILPPSVAIWVGKSPNSFCGAENWPLIHVVSPVWFLHGCLHIVFTHFVNFQYSALGHDSRSLPAQNGISPPSVAIYGVDKSPNWFCGAENWPLIHVVSPVCVSRACLHILLPPFCNIQYSAFGDDSRRFFVQHGILPPSVVIWVARSPNSICGADNWPLIDVVSPVCVSFGCLPTLLTPFCNIKYSGLGHDSCGFSAQNGVLPPSVTKWVVKSPESFCGAENWPLVRVVSPVCVLHRCLPILLTPFFNIQYSALGNDSRTFSAQNGVLPPSVAIWLATSPKSFCGAENWPLLHFASPDCVFDNFLDRCWTRFVNIQYSGLGPDSRSFSAQNGVSPPSVAIWGAKSPDSFCGAENWSLIHLVSPDCVLDNYLETVLTHFVKSQYSALGLDSRSFSAQNGILPPIFCQVAKIVLWSRELIIDTFRFSGLCVT